MAIHSKRCAPTTTHTSSESTGTTSRRRISIDRESEGHESTPGPLVLVGFMGAGKSTVGRLLAGSLGLPFIDLDDRIEQSAGRSVAEIFESEGESGFRDLEASVSRTLDPDGGSIVATGGGWMVRPELQNLWPDAIRVWLRVSAEQALARLSGQSGSRPLLSCFESPDQVSALVAQRQMHYQFAELWVDTDNRSPEEIVREIESRLSELNVDLRGGAVG